MNQTQTLEQIEAGMPILTPDGQVVRVSAELAARFQPGDRLAVVPHSGELLRIPAAEKQLAYAAVTRGVAAFQAMGGVSDAQITTFYEHFAATLEDDQCWAQIAAVNAQDVDDARARGRSTTRLVATEKLRQGMIDGLRGWIHAPTRRGQILETVQQTDFRVELVGAALGVVAFIFEGRPNVLADACGVLRGGNTVVFRIGSDALRTAKAIMQLAVAPALAAAGLPVGAVTLIESAAHAAGWALFSDERLALAVARGSGPAVATLGALARSVGVPVSLHGTGGAWLVAAASADATTFGRAVIHSLDRKVCNTLNTCCIVASEVERLVPVFLASLAEAGKRRNQAFKLHVVEESAPAVPAELFHKIVAIRRAEGDSDEPQAELLPQHALGHEWEWEESPEVTLVIVETIAEAVALFNHYSPQFIGALISHDEAEHQEFYETLNAPFVSNDYTRWVDGQFALHKPELGLSNWQQGRLFGRGAILSGDSVYTVRTRFIRE
ncbi:MAG: aldehyde dehydrogenase family protein [Caldilineaceae bacterium]|nr:aldehyde dehydrogenase family protein [Caldilineaceae bacterium]